MKALKWGLYILLVAMALSILSVFFFQPEYTYVPPSDKILHRDRTSAIQIRTTNPIYPLRSQASRKNY